MFYESEYMISVEIESTVPLQDLRDALQKACDSGAEFQFQILTTQAPSFVVLFWRDASEDDEYIAARMSADGDAERRAAAIQQLADELAEPGIELLGGLVSKLKNGEATLIDFGSLEHVQADLKPQLLEGPKVVRPMNHVGGLYMELLRPRKHAFERYAKELAKLAEENGFHGDRGTEVGPPCSHGLETVTQAVWFTSRKER